MQTINTTEVNNRTARPIVEQVGNAAHEEQLYLLHEGKREIRLCHLLNALNEVEEELQKRGDKITGKKGFMFCKNKIIAVWFDDDEVTHMGSTFCSDGSLSVGPMTTKAWQVGLEEIESSYIKKVAERYEYPLEEVRQKLTVKLESRNGRSLHFVRMAMPKS